MASPFFSRLIRFIAKDQPSKVFIGEPAAESVDVGLALRTGHTVLAFLCSGMSVLSPGTKTGQCVEVERVLSPLQNTEVGTVRCIGLNYKQHAKEVKLPIPKVPTLFMKPATALNDPYPAKVRLPRISQLHDCADYEAELAIVIGKTCINVNETEAYDYILGYTACNDVSSRTPQFQDSQWCFSKSFDGSCPIGPVLVSTKALLDTSCLRIRGLLNNKVVQDCGLDDIVFSVPKLISFLSQDTTLHPGTIIITGTPAGVGAGRRPPLTLKEGDEFAVEISPLIGTLINRFENA